MTELDLAFAGARAGDRAAFVAWMGRVERPIRASLRAYARAVDVEGVVQETLMRMWILAFHTERVLVGADASLRFAIGMARNIARSEARRTGRMRFLPPEDIPEPAAEPAPAADPSLREIIAACLERLTQKPRAALEARLRFQHVLPDSRIAALAGMTGSTLRQNVVRAREQLAKCLRGRGVPLEEILS